MAKFTSRTLQYVNQKKGTIRSGPLTVFMKKKLSVATLTLSYSHSWASLSISSSVSVSPAMSGQTNPLTFVVETGALPTGLSLNATTGVISGTPTQGGTNGSFSIKLTDSTTATITSVVYNWNVGL
jgi:large repetitive protein